MDDRLKAAIAALREPTHGRYRLDWLMGKHNGDTRARVLSLLLGQKIVKSKAGWGIVRKALYDAAGIDGGCEAERERRFADLCRQTMGEPSEQEEFDAKYGDSQLRQARRVLAEIPLCSAAGMARQIGCEEERGAELLALARNS